MNELSIRVRQERMFQGPWVEPMCLLPRVTMDGAKEHIPNAES